MHGLQESINFTEVVENWVEKVATDNPCIRIVDSDRDSRAMTASLLQELDYDYCEFESYEEIDGVDLTHGCVLCRLPLDDLYAPEFRLPVIFYTPPQEIQAAVEAMKLGAISVFEMPIPVMALDHAIQEGLTIDRLSRARVMRMQEMEVRMATISPTNRLLLRRLLTGKSMDEISAESPDPQTIRKAEAEILTTLDVATLREAVAIAAEFPADTLAQSELRREYDSISRAKP